MALSVSNRKESQGEKTCWKMTAQGCAPAIPIRPIWCTKVSIRGRILPANPLALPLSPPGVTGVFGAHVVAVDNASGALAGART